MQSHKLLPVMSSYIMGNVVSCCFFYKAGHQSSIALLQHCWNHFGQFINKPSKCNTAEPEMSPVLIHSFLLISQTCGLHYPWCILATEISCSFHKNTSYYFFSCMQQHSPRPVDTLPCVKLVELHPFLLLIPCFIIIIVVVQNDWIEL